MARLIDADKLKAHYAWWKGGTREMTMDEAKSDFDTIIDLQPTIAAEPVKHGGWEKNGEIMMFGDIPVKCSQCGFKTLQDALHRMDYHYCPNCGARMDEVEE